MTEMWITIYNYTIAPMIVICMMAFPITIAAASIYPFVKEYRGFKKEGYSSWKAIKQVLTTSNGCGNYTSAHNVGYTSPHYHSNWSPNSVAYATDPTYRNLPQNASYYRSGEY